MIPPALPRPPVSTCALTTTGPPSSSAAARASSGVVASRPSETGIPSLPEELLALVLVEIHERRRLAKTCSERQRLCDMAGGSSHRARRRPHLGERSSRAAARTPAKHHRTRRVAAGGRARLGRAVAGDGAWARLPRAPFLGHAERLGGGARDRERDDGDVEARRGPGRGRAILRCHALRDGRARRGRAARRGRRPAGTCAPPATSSPALPTELAPGRVVARNGRAPTARSRPGVTSGWCSARSSPRTSRLRGCRAVLLDHRPRLPAARLTGTGGCRGGRGCKA